MRLDGEVGGGPPSLILASHPAKLRGLNPISLSCEIGLSESAQGAYPKASSALGRSVVFAYRLVEDKEEKKGCLVLLGGLWRWF